MDIIDFIVFSTVVCFFSCLFKHACAWFSYIATFSYCTFQLQNFFYLFSGCLYSYWYIHLLFIHHVFLKNSSLSSSSFLRIFKRGFFFLSLFNRFVIKISFLREKFCWFTFYSLNGSYFPCICENEHVCVHIHVYVSYFCCRKLNIWIQLIS